MALFRFDLQGVPEPVNDAAHRIVQQQRASDEPRRAAAASTAARSERLLERGAAPERLQQLATSKASRRENIVRSYDFWLPLELVRLDYSTQHRFGRTRAQAELLIYESLSGDRWAPPKQQWNPVSGTCDAQILAPRVRAADIVKENSQLWQKLGQLKQAAAIDRTRSQLIARGVPPEAVAGSFHDGGEVLLPLHLAVVDGPKGIRIIAVVAHVGEANDRLSRAATEQAGWLRSRLA